MDGMKLDNVHNRQPVFEGQSADFLYDPKIGRVIVCVYDIDNECGVDFVLDEKGTSAFLSAQTHLYKKIKELA